MALSFETGGTAVHHGTKPLSIAQIETITKSLTSRWESLTFANDCTRASFKLIKKVYNHFKDLRPKESSYLYRSIWKSRHHRSYDTAMFKAMIPWPLFAQSLASFVQATKNQLGSTSTQGQSLCMIFETSCKAKAIIPSLCENFFLVWD